MRLNKNENRFVRLKNPHSTFAPFFMSKKCLIENVLQKNKYQTSLALILTYIKYWEVIAVVKYVDVLIVPLNKHCNV